MALADEVVTCPMCAIDMHDDCSVCQGRGVYTVRARPKNNTSQYSRVTHTGSFDNEQWVDVHNFSNYRISNLGRILNKDSGRFLKPKLNSAGMYIVALCRNGMYSSFVMRRLVAEHFLERFDVDYQVHARDNDISNFRADNLYQGTKRVRGKGKKE